VHEALKHLSPVDRELLEAAYYSRLSQSEIAKGDGIPLGTVKLRARQALKQLHTAFNPLV
jgi:RNA polymerase sigma-70 factor (ECF subfamily)